MPRQVESPIAKLLKLADDLTPEQIEDGIEILRAAKRRSGSKGEREPLRAKRGVRRATSRDQPTEPTE